MNTMRTQRVVLPLALLATAFFLGCQEQGSSPVEPDGPGPQFSAKKCEADDTLPGCSGSSGGTVDATWNASTADGTASDVQVLEGNLVGPNGSKNTLQTVFNEPVEINLEVFRQIVDIDHGNVCFGDGDGESEAEFEAIMMVAQVKPSSITDALINFFFRALGTDGTTDVDYVLKVFAKFQPGRPWPPEDAPLKSNTITGGTFVLAHVNGPGRKFACTGEHDLANFSVTITQNATEE